MHVGLILPSFGSSEVIQIPAISLLADTLAGQIDLTVIPLRNPPGMHHPADSSFTILDNAGSRKEFRSVLHDAVRTIRRRHRKHPFTVLHGYWLFEAGLVATLMARALRIPSVVSIGGAEPVALPAIRYGGLMTLRGKHLQRAIVRSATLVTGGSRYILDLAQTVAPEASPKMRFAPLPVKIPEAGGQPRMDAANRPLRLLQVGAYLPVKGHDLTIRALAGMESAQDQLELTTIGENPFGYRQRIESLANALGLGERVRLLERIPHAELAAHYQRSDLLLMPSRHESQGMVVLEAAARGLPTLGSDVGVVRDLAPDAACAVPTERPDLIARGISNLMENVARRRSLGAVAQTVVRNDYGPEPAGHRWLRLYQEALDGV